MELQRNYARESDVGPEGQIVLPVGDKLEREIAHIKDWMKDLDKKVDSLITDGCSHRGNDLAKLSKIELSTEGVRIQAGSIRESVHHLALSLESHKTEMVRASGVTDGKINNLKIGILAQCAILLFAITVFLVREFVLPAVKPHIAPVIIQGPNTGEPHIHTFPPELGKSLK